MKAGPVFDGLRSGTFFIHLSQYLIAVLHSLQFPSPRAQLSSECGRVKLSMCPNKRWENLCHNITFGLYLSLYGKNTLCIGKTLVIDPSQHIFIEYSIIHLHRNKFPFPMVSLFSLLKEDTHGDVILNYYFP